VKTLPHPDCLHFDAAVGWLMLGDTRSALAELERLQPESRNTAPVLEVEWGLHAQMEDWEQAFATAERLLAAAPDSAAGWIHRAYALRRKPGGSLPQAWDALRPALDRFPKNVLVTYNLACYAAQLGRPDDEAWTLFQQALDAAKDSGEIVAMALKDSDLEPLWARIRDLDRA
jgi:predicted Zn-dependent protease